MAQNQVTTTEEGMRAAAAEFGNKTSTFNGYLGSVNQEMAALQASWTGDASIRFNTAMDEWEQNFLKVINELILMTEALGGTIKDYSATEDANASIAQSFSEALPNF